MHVKNVQVNSNIKGAQVLFIVNCHINASVKSIEYTIYVHMAQPNGETLYAKCNYKAEAGGCWTHVAALLHQLCEYKELDMKIVPAERLTLRYYRN